MALPATESFAGAAGNLPNPPWVTWSTGGSVQTDGLGQGRPNTGSTDGICFWSTATDTFGPDQYSQYTVGTTLTGTGTNYIYLLLRASGNESTGSAYWWWCDGGSDCALLKVVGGVPTTLATANTTTAVATDVFRSTVTGSSIQVLKNGTPISAFTLSDSAVSSGQPGMGGFSTVPVTGVRFNTWIADQNVSVDTLLGQACL